MTPERWQQIEKVYHSALECKPDQRPAFLKQACAGDEALRREVESLLAHEGQVVSFMESPVVARAAEVMGKDPADSLVGRQVGPYKVLSPLGAGGMGEVYLAQDPGLERTIALKVLPAELASDRDRMRRFIREARAASALKHPNVATIHEIGECDGVHFIAMEYVEGQTLAAKIGNRPMNTVEILEIGIDVADALVEAHSKGITHRDIKPANLMFTSRGQVKVLDFGLAKVTRPEGQAVASDTSTEVSTAPGAVMGTVHYMSPEQILGHEVDPRTDIFSLGVVLYEMATGRQPFSGTSLNETMDGILHGQPEAIARFNYNVPAELERIVRKCLEKDRERRYQSTRDLLIDLKNLKRDTSARTPTALAARLERRRPVTLAWATALLMFLGLAGTAIWFFRPTHKPLQSPMKAVPLTSYPGHELYPSFSPDGNQVAFCWDGPKEDNFDVYVKLIGPGAPLRLTTHPAVDLSPAWSADGRLIAFLRVLSAKKAGVFLIPALGGSERKLAETYGPQLIEPFPGPYLAWSSDSRWLVVFDKSAPEEPFALFLLSIETGEKQRLTSPPPGWWADLGPSWSPDGRTLVFTRLISTGISDLYLIALSEDLKPMGEPKRLTFENRWSISPVWAPDGREIIFSSGEYLSGRSLWRIEASGLSEPFGKPERLGSVGEGSYALAISRQGGRLAYSWELTDINIWRREVPGPHGPLDGRTSLPRNFISSTRNEYDPQFSPDGTRIAFSSDRSGSAEIWVCDSDGSDPVQLTSFDGPYTVSPRWSPDGEQIVFTSRPKGNVDIYIISSKGGAPRRLTNNPAFDTVPSFSLNGRWIYFCSKRSGQMQVWKMPTSGGDAVQVTRKGGHAALESPDGKFLYYAKIDPLPMTLWKVPVEGGEESQVSNSLTNDANFAVGEEGLYFIPVPDSSASNSLQFLNFNTGKINKITEMDKPASWGLAVSPDQRSFLWTQVDQASSDLMLVEDFR